MQCVGSTVKQEQRSCAAIAASPSPRSAHKHDLQAKLDILEGRQQSEEAYLSSLQELQEAVMSQAGTLQVRQPCTTCWHAPV